VQIIDCIKLPYRRVILSGRPPWDKAQWQVPRGLENLVNHAVLDGLLSMQAHHKHDNSKPERQAMDVLSGDLSSPRQQRNHMTHVSRHSGTVRTSGEK
jgi:hypothetical protein